MRTTITIDDRLLKDLKKRAAETGASVSGLVESAVRLLLSPQPDERAERFELVTFGEGGNFTRRNIDKTRALLEDEDPERYPGSDR